MDTKSLEKVEGVISRGCDYSLCLSLRRMKIWRDEAFAGRREDPGKFVCAKTWPAPATWSASGGKERSTSLNASSRAMTAS